MVIILLAAYNGGEFIEQQLESIIAQTFQDWQLYIRDDHSTDDTPDIIENYSLKDKRIHFLKDDKGNLRSAQNFNALMAHCRDFGNYFMFCDQDDIWMSNKISDSLFEIKSIETQNEPAICFGTYELIDRNGNKIDSEPINYNHSLDIKILLAMNFTYGCTMILNKQLLDLCVPVSQNAENHDYWIALIAALSDAKYKYMPKPMLYYRQHGNNVSGSYNDSGFKKRVSRLLKNTEIKWIFSKFEMFQDAVNIDTFFIPLNKKKTVENYITAIKKGRVSALIYVISNRIRKITFLSTVNYYFSILLR